MLLAQIEMNEILHECFTKLTVDQCVRGTTTPIEQCLVILGGVYVDLCFYQSAHRILVWTQYFWNVVARHWDWREGGGDGGGRTAGDSMKIDTIGSIYIQIVLSLLYQPSVFQTVGLGTWLKTSVTKNMDLCDWMLERLYVCQCVFR